VHALARERTQCHRERCDERLSFSESAHLSNLSFCERECAHELYIRLKSVHFFYDRTELFEGFCIGISEDVFD
jgi:hypothetical protein